MCVCLCVNVGRCLGVLLKSFFRQVLSIVFNPGTSIALQGHIVGQIPALKSRYVPSISGPKGARHTNDWCINRIPSAYFNSGLVLCNSSDRARRCEYKRTQTTGFLSTRLMYMLIWSVLDHSMLIQNWGEKERGYMQ